MKITIDKDIYDFLRAIYFGADPDLYLAACDRAYLDMNRTIRFKGKEEGIRQRLRRNINTMLKKEISEIKVCSQESFDEWHKNLCYSICKAYENEGIIFTVGQAQKWINMSFKYLYMIGADSFSGIFSFLHIPLDNYVFQVVKNDLGIPRPEKAWSRIEEYETEYLEYQMAIRKKLSIEPLRWEFHAWLKEARNRE